MNYKKFLGATSAALMIVIVITLVSVPAAWAQSNYKVLYSGGNACDYPYAGLIFDGAGNFYGTCLAATGNDSGTVFEMSPNPDGTWTPTLLYSFAGCNYHPGPDGGCPTAAVIFDAAGNLYGTTLDGGLAGCQDDLRLGYGCGVVFKLTPNPGGGWTESLLYSFTGGADGANPYASLIPRRVGQSLRDDNLRRSPRRWGDFQTYAQPRRKLGGKRPPNGGQELSLLCRADLRRFGQSLRGFLRGREVWLRRGFRADAKPGRKLEEARDS